MKCWMGAILAIVCFAALTFETYVRDGTTGLFWNVCGLMFLGLVWGAIELHGRSL